MLIEFILALFVGILFGAITGLFPGIHINLVAAGLLSLVGKGIFGIDTLVLVVFVVAMAITHTFLDFIPSIFLGAPEEDSFLAVLPGHELLKAGKGYEAVVLTLYGSLAGLGIVLIFSFIFVYFLEEIYLGVRILIPYILIFASLYLVFREREFLISGTIFVLAGFLGLLSFNLPVQEPLLPLLSGLFGVSSLIVSLKSKTVIPKQEIVGLRKIKLKMKEFVSGFFGMGIAAPLCSFLPGIGSGHAAVIGSEIGGEQDRREFLFLVGGINTIVMALSFVTAFVIGKTRTGASAAVFELLGSITLSNLVLILAVVFISGIIAFFAGIFMAKVFASNISRISYDKINLFVLGILFVVNLVLTNWIGMIVLFTASALGVFCILSGVRRIQLMGVLLVPTIVFYLVL